MATTRLQLRTRVKTHLGTTVAALFTDGTIDGWLDEGLRRCAPVLLDEATGSVSSVLNTARTVTLPSGVVYVTRAYISGTALPPWRQFAGLLYLESAIGGTGPYTVALEYLGAWSAMGAGDSEVCPLADFQTDVLVYYAVSRAFRQLGSDRAYYKRYSTMANNNVDMEDLERLADGWYEDFERARLESRTSRQILFEKERLGGGPQVVGNQDLR